MSSPPFLLHLVHYLVCTTGIFANSLVLFLVWRKTPSSLKSYSVLIAFDAVVQLTTCACAGVLFTRVVTVGNAALSIVSGPARLTGSPELCFFLDSLMIFGYPHYSIMLVACFAFRYHVLVKSAPGVQSSVIIASLLSLPTLLITVLYALTPLDTQQNLQAKLQSKGSEYNISGMIIGPADVTQPIIAIALSYACLPSFPATLIVAFFARKIYRFLEENAVYMSESMRNCHWEIVTGLVIQACLPILYVIGIVCYMLGQFNIVDHYILEYSMNMFGEALVTICPVITIIFVQPYRRAAVSLLVNHSGISSSTAVEFSLSQSETKSARSLPSSLKRQK